MANQKGNSTAGQHETANSSTVGYGVSSLLTPPRILAV